MITLHLVAPQSEVLHLKHLVTFASILASTPNVHCLLSILSAKSGPYIPAVHVLLDVLICPIKGLGKGNGCFGECLEWKLSFGSREQASHVFSCVVRMSDGLLSTTEHM